jgi:beta-1,2-mannobiose phosphorylase / 1,2-beta-oligomannan phosphorylase
VVLLPEKSAADTWHCTGPIRLDIFRRRKMWLATSLDLIHWDGQAPCSGGNAQWNAGRAGARTRVGRRFITVTTVRLASRGGDIFRGASLLDSDNPSCIRVKSGEILAPETDYEREGFVPNVVFPGGAVVRGESLLVYYGAADESCAGVEWRLPDLLDQFLDAGPRGTR